MSITLVGLGFSPEHLTRQGEEAIKNADNLVVLTSRSPSYGYFKDIPHETLDKFFDEAESFEDTNDKASKYLLSLKGSTVLCADGDGVSGGIERAILAISKDVKVCLGVSSTSVLRSKAKSGESFLHITATDFVNEPPVEINRSIPLIITEIDDEFLASEIKLILLDKVGEGEIYYLKDKLKKISIAELDRQKFDHTSSIVIPEVEVTKRERYGFSDLIEIMKILRSPTGCPWDREQTHESIRKNLI
jgi:tetrapyrrole methylase family protein/MazG family protein